MFTIIRVLRVLEGGVFPIRRVLQGLDGGSVGPAAVPPRVAASTCAHVKNTIYARIGSVTKRKTLVFKMRGGVPPYRKLTLAEAFDI